MLTTEEAALRHVSLLVARGASLPEIFAAAAEQVARIFGRPWVGVMRYDSADSFVVLATWGEHPFPVGSRWPLDGPSTFEAVLRTGRPAAVPDYTGLPGTVADSARKVGIVGGFGAPIVVDDATWGVIAVPVTRAAGIPEGAETRLAVFSELVATAISNAETRDARARLVAEQAALRRIATLVARESSPVEVFVAVCDEARRILGSEAAGLLRFEPGGTATLVAQSETPWDPPPLGTSFTLDGENVVTRVFHTARAARADDWTNSTGAVAGMATVLGVRSAIAAPVIVEGRLWGTIVAASSQDEPLPGETERRIGPFTELIATAIANAEARDARAHLVEEQAALRRVATLVAAQAAPDDIHAAVAEEVALLLAAHRCAVGRYEPDETLTVTGYWSMDGTDLPVGTKIPLEGDPVTATVRQSRRSIRIDTFDDLSGPLVDYAREVGPLPPSTVGAPIVVDGQAWGIIFVSSMTDPLPGDAESRVVLFTELVATAIVNAESRSALRELVEEQAALRRVATLVAQQPSPEEIFEVVSVEVARVFGFDADPDSSDVAGVVRFEPGPALVPVGASKLGEAVKLGARFPADELYVSSHVLRTGRSARLGADDLDSVGGETADWFRRYGLLSQVGSPIVVEGRLWGAMTVNSGRDFPADTEERLERFTELIATAIANAESHDALARLADEQAALRRVATLVARGIGPEGVFRAVASEVGQLFGADVAAIVRFEDDGTVTVLGDVGGPHVSGKRVSLDEGYVVHGVRETGESSRFDTDDPSAADMPSLVRTIGIRSSVASPIVVEGALWGAITAASVEGPLPSSAERRLNEFTELVATAVANTHAREEVTALADEQAALRRVATLVAQGASPEEVFAAVAQETATAFDAFTGVIRFEHDPPAMVVVGASNGITIPIGSRWELVDESASAEVYRTGASARSDAAGWSSRGGMAAEDAARLGLVSQVSSPIVVDGAVWGAIAVNGADELPVDTEQRLERFTELLSTAIANAEAGVALRTAANEQSALRRVATLVALEASQDEIFTAVAEGVAGALGEELRLVRYEGDLAVVVATSEGPHIDVLPVGTRLPVGGDNALSGVFQTGEPTRIDDYSKASGPIAEAVRATGLQSIVATPVVVEGRTWGAMIVGTFGETPVPPGTEDRLGQFAELMATDIANTEARAELVASRARIVAAGDEARHRIERDLHDGTQQRLIALGLDLQRIRADVPESDRGTRPGLVRAEQDLEAILADLRELSHGLHPPLLARLGLGASLQALARRSPIPIHLDIDLPERPDASLETALYYVVSEALTNAIKHSHASEISVTISSGEKLEASIVDDGVGDADPAGGSGLTGLLDRVDALGGRFALDSPPQGGTRISIELPVEPTLELEGRR